MTRCPICGSEAAELDRTGDAEGYDRAQHGKFKVSRTALSTERSADQTQWEGALQKAKARAGSARPMIITTDF
jgi:hypothetical protein